MRVHDHEVSCSIVLVLVRGSHGLRVGCAWGAIVRTLPCGLTAAARQRDSAQPPQKALRAWRRRRMRGLVRMGKIGRVSGWMRIRI